MFNIMVEHKTLCNINHVGAAKYQPRAVAY